MYENANPTRDDAPELVDVTTRDGYNLAVIGEAIACQVDSIVNYEDGGSAADEELGAQIQIAQEREGAAQDRAVDHLVQMLLISYLDLEDLPRAIPAREESATEGVWIPLTAEQRAALRMAAEAIVNTSPEVHEVAAFEAILGALRPAA